jgi:hypothetical protein
MSLPASGQINISQLQNVMGGANPIYLSEYYQNASSGYTSGVTGIPNIGSTIRISNFYGKSKSSGGGGSTVPTPVQTVFTGTYVWSGGGSTTYEWVSGCSGTNASRTGVRTFNNIGVYGQYRTNTIYHPELILQARAGDTITFSVNMRATAAYTELIRAFINLGGGYYQIGSVTVASTNYTLTVNYVIPSGTAAGNYALCGMNDYASADGSYRSVNYYSLHIW